MLSREAGDTPSLGQHGLVRGVSACEKELGTAGFDVL